MSDAERNVNVNYNFTETGADEVISATDSISGAFEAKSQAMQAQLEANSAAFKAQAQAQKEYQDAVVAAQLNILQAEAEQQAAAENAMQAQKAASDATAQSFNTLAEAASRYNSQVDEASPDKLLSLNDIAKQYNQSWKDTDDTFNQYTHDVQNWIQNQQNVVGGSGYALPITPLPGGTSDFPGGVPDQSLLDNGGDGSGGGGDIGSLFSLARSARGASQFANLVGGPGAGAGLTGGADALYAVQGIRTLSDILPKLSQSFQDLPGLLGDMAAGGAAVAGSFGAVLSVAVPAALAITAAVEIIKLLSDETDKLAQADKAQYDEEQKLIDQKEQAQQQAKTETIPQAQGQLDTTLSNRSDQIAVLNEQQAKFDAATTAYNASLKKLAEDTGNPLAQIGDALDFISKGKDLNQVGKDLGDAAGKVSDLNSTYDSQTKTLIPLVNVNQQLLQQQQAQAAAVENQLAQNQRFTADDKLTGDAAKAKIDADREEIANQQIAVAGLQKLNDGLDKTSQQYADNAAQIKIHQTIIQNDTDDIKHLTESSIPLIQSREDETNAINALNAANKEHESFVTAAIKLAQSGTDQGVASERDTLVGKLTDAQNTVSNLTNVIGPLNDAQKTQLANAQALVPELQGDIAELDRYTANTVKAREALADVAKAQDTYTKTVLAAQVQLAGQLLDAESKEASAEKELKQGSLQDTEQRNQIALKESRDEVKIKQDTADAITDINTKHNAQLRQDDVDLSRQQLDDQSKFHDQIAKDELDAQRTQQQDAVDHAAKIRDIQQNAYQDEFSALLTRNFSKVAQDQAKEKQDEQKENTAYSAQESKLQTHLKQQEQDQNIALNQLEEQQIRDYQRKQADQQTAANSEIAQQNTNEQRKITAAQAAQKQALQDLTDSEAYKIKVLRYNLGVEEALYEAQEKRRIKIAGETEVAIILNSYKILGQAIGQLFGFGGNSQTVNIGGVTVQSSAPSLSGTGFDAGAAVANLVKGIFR